MPLCVMDFPSRGSLVEWPGQRAFTTLTRMDESGRRI